MNKTPDYFAPLIGWRLWNVRDNRLHAVTMGTEWIPYESMRAVHEGAVVGWPYNNQTGETVQGPCECEYCGIYAYRTAETMRGALWGRPPYVIGTVALWGRVVVHERGYRAQYAYPSEILYAVNCDGAEVARAYGIPFNEDLSWKSERQNESSSSSPWWFPSPAATWSGFQYLGQPRFPFQNLPPWTSRYILRPEEHEFIVKPPVIDPYDMDLPGLPKHMLAPKIELPKRYQRASGVWVQDDRIAAPDSDDWSWWPLDITTSTGVTFTPRYSSVLIGIDWAE